MNRASRSGILVWGFTFYAVCSLLSMATMSVGAAVLFVALVVEAGGIRAWVKSLRNAEDRPYFLASLGLAAVCLLSLVVAWAAPLGYGGKFVEVDFLKDFAKAWYLFWPLILAAGLRRLSDVDRTAVLRRWLLAFGALSALGVLQHFIGWPRPHMIPGHEPRYHAVLFLGHHLSLASVFIFPFFALLDFTPRRDRLRELRLPPWLAGVFVGLGALALFATYSRTLWIALPVGILAWILWTLPRKKAGIVGAVVLVLGLLATRHPAVKARLTDSMGVSTRTTLWLANLEFLKERPLTGAGWNQNLELSGYYLYNLDTRQKEVFQGHAHNNVLEVLGGTGALGLLAWLSWWGVVLAATWKAARGRQGFARGLLCCFLVFQINGLTQVNFWESKVLHQLMWAVSWALLWSEQRRIEESRRQPA